MKPLKALINKGNIKNTGVSKIDASKLKLSDLEEGNILISVHGYKYVVVPVEILREYLQISRPLKTAHKLAFVRQRGWQDFECYRNFPECADKQFNIKYVYQYTRNFNNINDLEQYFKNVVSKLDKNETT